MTREEAIEIVKTQYSHDSVMKTALGMLIPELGESEDEWIPKELIEYLKQKGDYRSCWIVWLKKQKDAFENGRQFGIMQEQARQELEWPDEKQEEQ